MNAHPVSISARVRSSALLAVLAGLPISAGAADGRFPSNPGLYAGGGAGYNSLNGEDYTSSNNNLTDKRVTYKALVGTRLSPNLSLEAQYVDFGTAEDGGNRVDAHGATAGLVFDVLAFRYFHPYAKAGALFWDADSRFSDVQRNDKGTDFTYGAGVRFAATRNLDIRTEYERFEFDDNRVNNVSANVQFNF